MEKNEIIVPDVKDIQESGSMIESRADMVEIVDDESNLSAQALLQEINKKIKVIEPVLEEPVVEANKLHKRLRAWADGYLNPFYNAKKSVAAKIGAWDMAIQEQRRREAAEADRKAREKAEKERQAQILAAKKAKDKEAVEALKSAPLEVKPVAPKTPEASKAQGVNVRYKWVLDQVFNPLIVPNEFKVINTTLLNDRIGRLGNAHGIPGVSAKQVPITSGR